MMFCFPDELKACHILDVESINGIIFVYTNKNRFIFQMFNSFRKTDTHTHIHTYEWVPAKSTMLAKLFSLINSGYMRFSKGA